MIINKNKWSCLPRSNELLHRIILNIITNSKDLEAKPIKDNPLEVTMFINGVECDIEASTFNLNARYSGAIQASYNKGVDYGKEEAIAILASKFTDIVSEGYTS